MNEHDEDWPGYLQMPCHEDFRDDYDEEAAREYDN